MGCRTAEACDGVAARCACESHTIAAICAASARRGVGGPAQMGRGAVSCGHTVAGRARGRPLCNRVDGQLGVSWWADTGTCS